MTTKRASKPTKAVRPAAPREVRVPLTASQSQQLSALFTHHRQAEEALKAAVQLLTAGHVEHPFSQFRIEPDAFIAILP